MTTQGTDLTPYAHELLSNNICAVPCKMPEKKPALDTWTKFQSILPSIGQHSFNGALGVITGAISGNLFVLDIDLKYDITGTLLQRLETDIGPELWDRIFQAGYIQRTVNNGLHIFLKCEQIEKNQKLAKRYATAEELAIKPDDPERVLLETRSEGGFIVIAPTAGYTSVSGSLLDVGFISVEDKERLFEICRSFNEVWEEVKAPTSKKFTNELPGLPPWKDFDQRADVPGYLLSHGWTYLKTVGENQHYCRPGKKGYTSGTYHTGLNLFRNFSTSAVLQADKSYSPSALFAHFDCSGDFAEAARKLYSIGYGKRSDLPTDGREVKKPLTPSELAVIWKEILIDKEPPAEISLIEIEGITIATPNNHSLVIGKKKTRKTLFIVWLVSLCPDAIVFDTEQSKTHVWRVRKKIKALCSKDVPTFYLRGKSPAERKEIIYQTVKNWPALPKVVIIDGIRDLLSNINDPDQATDLLVWLEKLTNDFGVHVINVLHTNKNDNNARGHIGSELTNKAQTTIELELDEKANVTIVKCESSRDKPFTDFAFTHGPDDLPELVSMPVAGNVISDEEKKNRIRFVFNDFGDFLKYPELLQGVKESFSIGTNKAKNLISDFVRKGWIVKNGKDRSKDVVYKVMV